MIISDLIDAKRTPAFEWDKDTGVTETLMPKKPEGISDRLELRYLDLDRLTSRLTPEGRSEMDRLLSDGFDFNRNELTFLFSVISSDEDDTGVSNDNLRRNPIHSLDMVLDSGSGGMANLYDALDGLSPEDQEIFLQTLSTLLKRGVMGYEYRKVNGQPYKVYLTNEIGSEIHRAKLYRRDQFAISG